MKNIRRLFSFLSVASSSDKNVSFVLAVTLLLICTACKQTPSPDTSTPAPVPTPTSQTSQGSPVQYAVTVSGDSNETFFPAAEQMVTSGSTQAFTITANAGYTVSSVVGGNCPTGSWSGSTYTLGTITRNCSVTFSATINSYTVSAAGINVSVFPASPQVVVSGSTKSFTVTANPGYFVSPLTAGNCTSGTWSGSTYTTGAIANNCFINFSLAIPSAQWAQALSFDGNSLSAFYSAAVDNYGNPYFLHSNFQIANSSIIKYNSSAAMQWTTPLPAGPLPSLFNSLTSDSNGNVYASGYSQSVGEVGPTVVKVNSTGSTIWTTAFVPVAGGAVPSGGGFSSSTTDSLGNVYAAGSVSSLNWGLLGLGNGVTAYSYSSRNAILVKYNSAGVAQWAKTPERNWSSFYDSVATDNSGNVYVVGTFYGINGGSATIDFGNGILANIGNGAIGILVKYNSLGTAQWARVIDNRRYDYTTTQNLHPMVVDAGGNTFVASNIIEGRGSINGISDLPNGASAVGIAKYNSAGQLQWVHTAHAFLFTSIAVDSNGNAYVSGETVGEIGTVSFGNGVSVSENGGQKGFVVNYSASGVPQWALATISGFGNGFRSVVLDTNLNMYVTGWSSAPNQSVGFGNGIYARSESLPVAFMVKFSSH